MLKWNALAMSIKKQIYSFLKYCLPLLMVIITAELSAQKEQENKRPSKSNKIVRNFDISYDLRACEDSFQIIWQYYQSLGAQKGPEGSGRTFSDFWMLQTGKGIRAFCLTASDTQPNSF